MKEVRKSFEENVVLQGDPYDVSNLELYVAIEERDQSGKDVAEATTLVQIPYSFHNVEMDFTAGTSTKEQQEDEKAKEEKEREDDPNFLEMERRKEENLLINSSELWKEEVSG